MDQAKAEHIDTLAEPKDRSFAAALSYEALRYLPQLDALAQHYLRRPFKAKDWDLAVALRLGFLQLGWMAVSSHAAVFETVNLCEKRGKRWAKGVINGVLRRYQRDGAPQIIESDEVSTSTALRFAHPEWLIERIRRGWGDQMHTVLAANNKPGPMWLRINAQKTNRDDYLSLLEKADIAAAPGSHSDQAIILDKPIEVTKLPGFADGLVSVQDQAAQLAAALLSPNANSQILDICAAPGGKTAHLLEQSPAINMTAVDIDGDRLRRVAENLHRIGASAELVAADATTDTWHDNQTFDAILLDAPCSGTGVIRRHPDIKWLRRESDIDQLQRLQAKLLDKAWDRLSPGGKLLYATCSILPAENRSQIEEFLARTRDAKATQIEAPWGQPCGPGRQILPGDDNMDGFFYALLEKTG